MTATLPSNSGEQQFAIELGPSAEYACDAGFESSIHIRGRHWDGDHTYPFSSSMEGLWLRTDDLVRLRDHISQWLRQPGLVAEDLSAEFHLARLPGQDVHIRFGPRADTITGLNPIVTLTFAAGALRGEFHFVTDQSCLALFSQELTVDLIGSPENAV